MFRIGLRVRGACRALTILCLLFLRPLPAAAQWGTYAQDATLISLSAAGSLFIHEMGHELTGLALGEHLEWKGTDWTIWEANNHNHIQPIALQGFIWQSSYTKLLGMYISQDNPFLIGARGYYIINTTQYVIRSALAPGGYGDFQNFNSRDRSIMYGVLGADVAVVAIQLFAPNALPKFIRNGGVLWTW